MKLPRVSWRWGFTAAVAVITTGAGVLGIGLLYAQFYPPSCAVNAFNPFGMLPLIGLVVLGLSFIWGYDQL